MRLRMFDAYIWADNLYLQSSNNISSHNNYEELNFLPIHKLQRSNYLFSYLCIITRQFTFEKQQGLHHNKVTLRLTPVKSLAIKRATVKWTITETQLSVFPQLHERMFVASIIPGDILTVFCHKMMMRN